MPQSLRIILCGSILWATLFLRTGAAPIQTGVTLELTLDVPPIVTDVSKFIIYGKLTNTGPQTINIVKDPSGPLFEGFAINAYQFKKAGGKSVEPHFMGVDTQWSLDSYLKGGKPQTTGPDSKPLDGSGDDSGSTGSTGSVTSEDTSVDGNSYKYNNPPPKTIQELPGGDTLNFTSKVGNAYDFTEAGAGEYEVNLRRKTFFVLVDDDIREIDVDVNVNSSKVKIEGKLASLPQEEDDSEAGPRKREITAKHCSAVERRTIREATKHADEYVQESLEYLTGMSEDSETERYSRWFGDWKASASTDYDYAPKDQVESVYRGLRSFQAPPYKGYTYSCYCDPDIDVRYTYGTISTLLRRRVIHLCSEFFPPNIPYMGQNSKVGILVRQAIQFTNTESVPVRVYVKGRIDSYNIAVMRPHYAAINVDNYGFFTENVIMSKEELNIAEWRRGALT